MATNNSINLNQAGITGYDGAGTFVGSPVTQHSLLLGGATTDAITSLGVATNGQLPIGSTGADPVLATLTAGTGISIVNGAGSITVNSTVSSVAWTVVTGATQAIAVNNGYISNAAAGGVAYTLPATAAVGSIIRVTGLSGGSGWTIAQNAGQSVQFGTSTTTVGAGGSLASTQNTDTVEMVCAVADTTFIVLSSVGNITIV